MPHVGVRVKVPLIPVSRYSKSHRCVHHIYNSPPEPHKATDIVEFAGILTSTVRAQRIQSSLLAIFSQIYCRHRTANPVLVPTFNTSPSYNHPAMSFFYPNT
ncbi:hypothetical protein AX14_007794 [Amanita brunnescens Koide BX004]|nr:hypothetical protein AX14_007794 [Amanita brunnescens Koide BX004]